MGFPPFHGLQSRAALDAGSASLLIDTFTDANSTDLTAHTMDLGGGWASQLGTWDIQGNQCLLSAGAGDTNCVITADAGLSDVTLTADLNTKASGDLSRALSFRVVDNNNYWIFLFTKVDGCRLFEKTAGSYTLRASEVNPQPANSTTYRLKMISAGQIMTVYVDDVQVLTHSSSVHQSATRFGLYGNSGVEAPGAGSSGLDNFLVTA